MIPDNDRPLPNAADKATLKAIASRVITDCPSLHDTAREVAGDLLKKHGITGLDPDRVYFHRFDAAQSNGRAFTGWEHVNATPTSTLTLTQLVIQRFRVADQDNADLLDVYAGFYTAGPAAGTFNETNEVRLHGDEVLKDFWSIDFSALYKERLTAFWQRSGDDFRILAKCNFLLKAVQARDKRQLSDEDFRFVTHAALGPLTWPVTLDWLRSAQATTGTVRTLDVAGFTATDILRFVAPKGRQIVYLPGEANAFTVLETATDMHFWMLLRMNKPQDRQAFMTHFSLADRQQISDDITDLMNRLVSSWGRYDHHLINQNDTAIGGDAFTWLQASARDALFIEAELTLVSNGDLRKKLWIGYLSAGMKVFAPMAVVGWPVALPLIGASIADMGLNIDQAVNGRTPEERKAGILGAVLAGIDLLLNVLTLGGPGSLEEVGPAVEAAEASETAELKNATQPSATLKPSPPTADAQAVEPPRPESGIPASYRTGLTLDDTTLSREPGRFQGIHSLPSDPSWAIRLGDGSYYVRYETSANGTGHWAIIDPARPNAFVRSIPVRLNAAGQWEPLPRLGLKGGMDVPHASTSAAQQWAQLPGTQVPEIDAPDMRAWALGGADDVRPVTDAFGRTRALSRFELSQETARDNLISDARAWYAANPVTPRLPVATAAALDSPDDLLDAAFAQKPGLVIGETQGGIGSKQFLIENMPALAGRGVKTLYVQQLLANVNQSELDTFALTGQMPAELEEYLRKLDFMSGNDPDGRFTLTRVVRAANAAKIRVQALDLSTTYHVNRSAFGSEPGLPMTRSFFAGQVIRFNEAIKGPARWVALVNREHMTTFRGHQGITEQADALSLRFDDVPPGLEAPIGADPGVVVEYYDYPGSPVDEPQGGGDLDAVQARIQGTWRVQMPTPWAYRTPQELRALLPEPGMFTFQRYRNSILVVYRNEAQQMADSVVRMTPGGRISLQVPMRPEYDFITADDCDELKQALMERGLRPMGWPLPPETAAPPPAELPQGKLLRWQANEVLEGKMPDAGPGRFQGIYRLDGNPATAISLDGDAYYVRFEPDANGPGTWAIVDPARPNAFSGTVPVRLNAQGEWELAPGGGLKGGGNNLKGMSRTAPAPAPPSPPPLRLPVTGYDSPPRYSLRKLALGERETHIKIMRLPDGTMKGITPYDEHVAALRRKLSGDVLRFFARKNLFSSLPARPPVPALTPTTTAADLIDKVFASAPGLVVGESQDRIASLRFLIENMPNLARQGVRTLYVHRLLNDFSQTDLNAFFRTGEMSGDLERALRQLQSDPSGVHTLLETVKAARLNEIRVQATDCLASYRYPDASFTDRQEQAIKNYLTHTVMQADQSLNGAGKWVVLTGQENTNTFRGVAGISELQGGIGLRIEEVPLGEATTVEIDQGIRTGKGYMHQEALQQGEFDMLYADLSLKLAQPPVARTPADLERILMRRGMFTFEKAEDAVTLIHRSRDGQIVRTPLERPADGTYRIHRPGWVGLEQMHFASLEEMSWALSEMGMNLEGRLPR
ncbi:membrane-targeted effector domain-containing toxin [Pseudomonas sp. COR58]|uniref:Membrane-targeted effector domain-containing toxin n=1 Tax=Pseudomonas ekonensis TaxID=2842353 RepID=A0ABS6P8Q6_9PSED|nr:membrane-targeted effector domain-containing toxin [Pseudomonas ekonensis]MBV4456847.1 membrane-targeted effector domain-containing toxin [Pseudomonas ekonensis]